MKRSILLCLFAWLLHVNGWAQLSNVTNGYVGNTFSGDDNKWVQNYATEVDVASDGTLVTASDWDEAGRCVGIFKDAQPVAYIKQYNGAGGHSCWGWGTSTKAIAIDDAYLYVNNCQGELMRFSRSNGYAYVDQTQTGEAVGMTVSAGNLYLVKASGLVEKRSAAGMGTVSLSFTVAGGYDVAVDGTGSIWVLTTNKEVLKYSPLGSYTNTKIAAQTGWQPSAVNYDAYNNLLLVPDNGPHRQVKRFNTSGTQTGTFGTLGGISAGTKGVVGDLRFWDIAGSGTDALGNVYVGLNENAVSLRKFTAGGAKQWEVLGMMFTDIASIDPASDGTDLYGVNEHMKFDYASQQWSLTSITNDKIAYPNDPRNMVQGTAMTSALMRRVNGNLLMFTASMYAGKYDVFRFEGETAVHCQAINEVGWSGLPDKNGNVWYESGGRIRKIPLTGFSGGCPVFGAPVDVTTSLPAPMTTIERLEYNADTDVMYIGGWTAANPSVSWGLIGSTLARYPNWSTGNRTPSHSALMPKDYEGLYPKAMSVAGDYVFVGNSRDRGKVYVFNGANLTSSGHIAAPTNMGETGWLDIVHAVQAFKKSDGQYLVLVEDNSKGKNILYQWAPPAEDVVFIASPGNNAQLTADIDPVVIEASVRDADGSIARIEFYEGATKLAEATALPYRFNWTTAAPGSHTVTAKAIDRQGNLVSTSGPVTFSIVYVPDVVVTDINWTPELPAAGTAVTFSVTVKNAGRGSVPAGVVIGGVFSVDGQTTNWTDTYQAGLAPGASAVLTATSGPSGLNTWTMKPGTQQVSFRVDDVNRIKESNEDNNTFATYLKDALCADQSCLEAAAGLLHEQWNGIGGSRLDDLLNHPSYPDSPSSSTYLSTFEAPTNAGYDFGARVRGFVVAPVTGDYTFWIASDDESRLWLSTDENPANVRSISWVPEWTGVRQWDRFDSQRSGPITLQAGQKYYVEALMKAGGANDNLAVGWQLPDGTMERPIPGNRVEPLVITKPDLVVSQFSWTPTNPASGTPVSFSATVKNIGIDATPEGMPVKVSFSVDGQSVAVVSTAALAPGAAATVTASIPGLAAGLRVLKAMVDPSNEIAESDENYNLRTRTVAVTATRRQYEAERASLKGAKTANNRTGFSGTGFVQFGSTGGNFIEWQVNTFAEGTYGVQFRYASEIDRPTILSLSVNGVVVDSAVRFASTGSWSNWSDVALHLALKAGVNSIRLTTVGSKNPNLDYLAVTDPGEPTLAPAASAARVATAGLTAVEANQVWVYPNPAADHFTIRVTVGRDGKAGIRLTDLLGRGVQATQHEVKAGQNLIRLPAAHLNNGLYLLNVTTEAGNTLRKVQISR